MKKIDLMFATFGVDVKGRRCRDCPCLVRAGAADRALYKCTVYGDSGSAASDWSAKWTACGRFGKPLEPGEYSVLHMHKREPRPKATESLPGQTRMEV